VKRIANYFISSVWLASGLFCKVLNLVPRHQEIVARILGPEHAGVLTKMIGAGEILIAIWILSGYKKRVSAIFQMIIIAVMNVVEFLLAPNLLLWGKMNIVFAFLFIVLIGYNEFSCRNTFVQPA
jgi:uncharacterized membrane protein YphA (DoxX/SURF4 family)